MKANEVLKILRITRPTLHKYLKEGRIKATRLDNGHWDYDRASIYQLIQKGESRKTYIYARISNSRQKKILDKQVSELKQFCLRNGYAIDGVFFDVADGINFENRRDFLILLQEVLSGKVERIVISCKSRVSRISFGLFQYLCDYFSTEIISISDVGNFELDQEEFIEELNFLLGNYSVAMFSGNFLSSFSNKKITETNKRIVKRLSL
jgi:predicted site-specific integrase-resolvase